MKNSILRRIVSFDIFQMGRTALPKNFLLLLIVFVCSLAPESNCFGQTNPNQAANQANRRAAQAQKQAANQAQHTQQQRAMLTQKYNMDMAQIQQYETLQKVCTDKIAAINKTPGLSKKERYQKIGDCRKEFQASVEKMLTPQQLSAMKANDTNSNANAGAVGPIVKSYNKEYYAIRSNKGMTPAARTEAFAQLDKTYESRLAAIVGNVQARRIMKRQVSDHNANTIAAKKYNLAYTDAQKYNGLGNATKFRQNKLDSTTMTRKDRVGKQDLVKAQQDAKVKTLLGDSRFNLWHRDHSSTVDQRLKSSYGFSDQQVAQYKDLQNQQAVAILKIRQGKGTAAEKQASMAQARAETDQKVRQMLTPEQYGKMTADRHKAQTGPRRKTIDAHTVKPTPKAAQTAAANTGH